ncbi:hypothetical protein ACLMJK_007479 [Lecanora helva]
MSAQKTGYVPHVRARTPLPPPSSRTGDYIFALKATNRRDSNGHARTKHRVARMYESEGEDITDNAVLRSRRRIEPVLDSPSVSRLLSILESTQTPQTKEDNNIQDVTTPSISVPTYKARQSDSPAVIDDNLGLDPITPSEAERGISGLVQDRRPFYREAWERLPSLMSRWFSSGQRSEQSSPEENIPQRLNKYHNGYPKIAALHASENNLICRRFAWIRTRLLLCYQDELAEMEERLIHLDDDDSVNNPDALRSREYDDGYDESLSRKRLFEEMHQKLRDYDELARSTQKFVSMTTPPSRYFSAFRRFIKRDKPLTEREEGFLEREDDLVALEEEQERGWLDGLIEARIQWGLPETPTQQLHAKDNLIRRKSRVEFYVRLNLTVTTVFLLMAPSAILFLVPGHNLLKLMLILLFVLLFSAALSIFTKA